MAEAERRSLRIVQVSKADVAGGAEKGAALLHRAFLEMGQESILAVGHKRAADGDAIEIDNASRDPWTRALRWVCERLLGWRALSFPGSFRLAQQVVHPWDVLILNNLHGDYFDLRAMPALTRLAPTILRVHDCWLATGGCGHPLGCERFDRGCFWCPEQRPRSHLRALKTYFNRRAKRAFLREARLCVSAPSNWVAGELEKSTHCDLPVRIEPYGIDLRIYRRSDRSAARARLGLAPDTTIVLFCANGGIRNPFKDGPALLKAAEVIRNKRPDLRLEILVLGADANSVQKEDMPPYVTNRAYAPDESVVADYYCAADVLALATKADNVPLVMSEAMACGLPVVATAVGGIPEYVEHEVTGLLVRPGDANDLAGQILRMIGDGALRERVARNALAQTKDRNDLQRVAEQSLDWYRELVAGGQAGGRET